MFEAKRQELQATECLRCKERALAELAKAQAGSGDPELAHAIADNALIALLIRLGYREVADAWAAVVLRHKDDALPEPPPPPFTMPPDRC